MGRVQAKIFRRHNKILVFDYSGNNYYEFVKNYRDDGYSQVIITSEMMLNLLKSYFVDRKFSLSGIELLADDGELNKELEAMLDAIQSDRDQFATLLSRLEFLIEDSSIDIKKIEVNNKRDTSIYYQVNGLIGITSKGLDKEKDYIISKIAEYMNV